MTLEQLRTDLDSAKTGTNIAMVIFDFLTYANIENKRKEYPLIVWDIDNLTGTKNLRAENEISGTMAIDMYCMQLVTPEDDMAENKLVVWDDIEAAMLTYLHQVNGLSHVSIPNLTEIEYEYYPAGMLSMERELGVLYKSIGLQIWC